MKKNIFILALLFSLLSIGKLSAQFTSAPCTAGPLPNSCTSNTITLTTAMNINTVPNPVAVNGVGCSSVGSDITAGTIYDYEGWFTSTVAADGTVSVYAAIITGDPVVAVYTGTCGSLTFRACDDDGGTGLDALVNVTSLTPGSTVWIRVWDYNGGTGQYQVTTNGGTPPVNNLCAAATGLTVNAAPIPGTNYCATVSAGDPADCQEAANTNNNVWYSFVVPTAPSTVTVNYTAVSCFGSGVGITAGVYSGTCGSFSNLVCRAVSDGSGGSSTFTATAAGTYYIMIDGDFSSGATSLCNFNVDVDIVGCPAYAGVNNEPATQNICANTNYTLTVAGNTFTNTNVGANPCLGWGFWLRNDPLNAFPGVTPLTAVPTTGVNAPNYLGVFTSLTYPLANGSPAILPAEGNGATYYIAPVTLSNCQIGETNSACVNVGNFTQATMIPEINTSYVINCDVSGVPTTRLALTISGGQPSIGASSYTLTSTGSGTLSSTTVANNGTVNVTGIPNNGTVTITITDGAGCSRVFTVGPIVAADYCPTCGANAGNTLITQVGDGITELNNGTNVTTPFILCYGDQITLNTTGFVLPTSCNAAVDNGLPPGGGSATCNPVLMYALLNNYSLAANPVDDNTFTGVGSSGPVRTFVNNGTYLQSLQTNFGMMPPNNTLVMYPFTADHAYGAYWWPDSNNDNCVDAGAPIKITFLNDILAPRTQTCNGPSFVLTGGYPEFFPGTFGVVNNGLGTLSSSTINHGGTLTITGLTSGQPYSFTVTDNNGCPKTFSGTYTYTPPTLAITGLGSSFCVGDPVDAFTATPIGTSTTYTSSTTGGVTIHLESDGYCNEWTWYIDDALGNVVAAGNTWSNASLCNLPANSNLAPIVINGLNLLNGPFTFHIADDFSDGQGGATFGSVDDGSVYITNNNGGAQIGPTRAGDWGASTTISLVGLTPTSTVTYTVTSIGTLSGTDVTQTGNVSGNFDPNTVGTYPITYTYDDGRSCVFTQSQNVTVNQVPALSSPTNPVICAGQSITLSTYNPIDANGTTGVGVWHSGNTPAGAVVTTVTPTNGQQYCYEWTATGNCRDNKVITVTVNALPTVTASSFTVCQGGSATITAGGASSYLWNTGVTSAGLTINPVSATTVYTVTGTAANTCTNTATGTITMNARPTVTASSFTVCENGSATITGGGASSYVWNTGATTAGLTINPVTATTTYTVTGTAANTCTNTAIGTITMNPRPTVTASSFTVCEGSSATITASGANTYVWNTGISTAGLTVNPVTATTTYTVTGTAANTCTNTATGTITMNPRPTVTASSFTVCQGGSATITAGGASSYLWNTGITSAGLTINPVSATTTYTVTGTAANTCTNTATGTITMNPRPTVTASSFTVCENGSATITGGGASSYVWNTGATTAGLTINPVTATTTYTVTGTAANTCTNTAIGTITMNPRPTVTASSFTVCENGSATITAGGANTYVWNTGISTAGLTVNPVTATTTYTVTGTAANTCTNTATGTITMNPRPTVTASSFTVCQGSSATITAGGASSYLWNTGITSAGLTINPVSATTTYTVTGTAANTCTNTATGTITMNPLPTVTAATSSQSVCSGTSINSITFVTNPATGVTLNWTNSNTGIGLPASGSGQIINGVLVPVVAVQTQGVISAVATITASGCSNVATATGTVTINPNPTTTTPATVNNPAVCGGNGSLTGYIAGPNVVSYSWNTSPIQNTQNATNIPAGAYTVLATDNNGCTVSTPYVLNDPTTPSAPAFTVSSAAVCAGSTVTLSVVSPSGGSTYNWSGPSGSLGAGSSITITPTVTGNYNVSTSTAGCTGLPSANTSITVNSNPTGVVTGNGTQFCAQTNFVLSATSSTGGGTATINGYQWYGPSGLIAGATSSTYTTSAVGSYSVMVTNNNTPSCQNTSPTYVITNFSEPVLSVGAPTITNSDCVNPTGGISGITVSSGTANYTYTWMGTGAGFPIVSTIPSTNAPSLTNQPAGTYSLAVSDANGCKDTTIAYTINNLSAPSSPLVATNAANCSGSPMNPVSVNDVTNLITWYSDPSLTNFVGTGNPFTPVTTTTHTLYVTSTALGCSSAATTVTVTVNPKPAAPASLGNAYCAGQTINDLTVTSSIGGTVAWYSNVSLTTQVATGTPFATGVSNSVAGTTTYYVAETALGCLGDYTQVDVTVNANPLIDTTNMVIDTASCDGTADGALTNINVTGTGPLIYTWSGATGVVSTSGSTPDLTTFPTGTYTLVVTDGNTPSCSATLSNLVINAFNQPTVPVLSASSDLLYCDGETVTALTATSTNPIFWYSDATLTTQVGLGASYTPVGLATDATFYAIANNGGCLSVPLSVAIDFHATPATPTVNDAVYCRGDAVADLVVTGTNISWFADNTTTINIGTGSPFASGVSNAGVTTIWYTDSISYTGITCGSDTGSVTIRINNLPVIDITTSLVVDSATCGATSSGGSIAGVVVSGTPGLTYTWSNANGVVSTSTTTANLVNQAAGSYTLVVTDGNTPACSATSSAITINTYSNPANPVFVTSSDTVYCVGETISALQANTSNATIQWYSDAALTTIIGSGSPFTPTGITSSTTVYLVASNNNCKSDSIPVSITFNQLPNISANSPTVCDGSQVTLSGTNSSGNATTYSWNNGITNGVAFTATLPGGPYVVTGADNITNCVNTFTTTLNVLNTPTVSSTVGSSTSVCSGGTITLSGTGASTYSWTGGVVDGLAFTPSGVGSYTVTGTDFATACTNTFVVNVSIDNPPTVNTGVTATIPCGSTSSAITGVTTNAITPVYSWSGPNIVADGNTATPTLGAAGQYTLTVVDNTTGCSSTSTLDITSDAVIAALTPDVITGFAPLPVVFTNQSTGATSYAWNFGDGQTASTTTLAAVTNTFATTGTYTVTLTATSNSCSATATVTIIVDANSSIFVPNIFSPNGDNINDVLTIISIGLSELNIDIFNRWGSKVYVISAPGQNWDGKLTNGESAAEGTYFYILKAVGFDKKEYEAQGPIMLVK